MINNAFTVDVEDYYHVSGFDEIVDRQHWSQYESRVVNSTRRLIRILAEHDVCATFFVLGWVAERHPELVREIQDGGHEIGSHSYWHRLIYQLTPEEFREDLLHSCKIIEEITGERVTSFRAPSFSITKDSMWALDILAEEGISLDSSIFPVHHDRYGVPGAERFANQIDTPAGSLWEVPPSVCRLGKWNVPVGGGGYFRLYPLPVTNRMLSTINRRHGQPFVFYIHPWEIDPDQPRLPVSSRSSRFRHYTNLASTEGKLHRLLSQFSFGPLSSIVPAPMENTNPQTSPSPLPAVPR